LNIIYIKALIVSFRLIIIIRIYDVIFLTFFLKILMMIEYLLSNFRFAFSALVIRVSANSSACMSAPAILSNLSIFLLIYFRARLREAFSFLNTAKIFYIEFYRFPVSIFIKILIAIFRSMIVISICAFTAEKFVLKSVITF
jgi:hypothetical protein